MKKDVMPYCIGSNVWNGLSKLNEEMGEVQQVIGKIIGNEGRLDHWDGSNLRERLQDEIGDVLAAIKFVANKNALTWSKIDRRADAKYAVFCNWNDNTSRRGTGEANYPCRVVQRGAITRCETHGTEWGTNNPHPPRCPT